MGNDTALGWGGMVWGLVPNGVSGAPFASVLWQGSLPARFSLQDQTPWVRII